MFIQKNVGLRDGSVVGFTTTYAIIGKYILRIHLYLIICNIRKLGLYWVISFVLALISNYQSYFFRAVMVVIIW